MQHQAARLDLDAVIASGTSLVAAVRGRAAAEARAFIADLKSDLEGFLDRDPDHYEALVLLGELNLCVGLCRDAQALLYKASLQQPPSWAAYQRTSYLLRRAEEQQQKAFDRVAGAAPPRFVRRAVAAMLARARSLSGKRNHSLEVGV